MANHRLINILVLLLIVTSVSGQVFKGYEAQKYSKNSKKIWLNSNDSTLKFIEFTENNKSIKTNRIQKLEDELNLSSEMTYSEIEKTKDNLGIEHTRNQQNYRGIPIEGGMYNLHSRNGNFQKANGEFFRIKNLDIKPRLNEADAFKKAKKFVNSKIFSWEVAGENIPKGKLVVLPVENSFCLAYKFDIYSIEPLSRKYVFVNALTGKILKVEDRIREHDALGTAVTKYNGSQNINSELYNYSYRLQENDRGNGIQTLNLSKSVNYSLAKDFTDNDNYWNTTANQDDAATNVHFAIEKTYDFFLNRFGRNSFDNNGGVIQNYIHYGSSYNNAFWDGNRLFFGDGDGTKYSALTSIEVVAHEFTHAVTQYTADLGYSGESGALNESFSDIFGAGIDYYSNPSSANFIIGEKVFINGAGFRNMSNPNQMNDPDTYNGNFWYTADGDNGGVHTNSGVQNFWFFLLCNGGSGINDLGKSYRVTAIGMEKALDVAYRNLTIYLTSNSDYEDARFYSIQAAIDLYGQCSDEVVAVTNAWYAVGVGEEFTYDIKTAFEVIQTTSVSSPFVVNFVNETNNATDYLWDFGDGNISTDNNPSFSYEESGLKNVTLIASNCHLSDTISKLILVTPPPSIEIDSQNFVIKIKQGSSEIRNFTIKNISDDGILNYSIQIFDLTGGYEHDSCLWLEINKSDNDLNPGNSDSIRLTINPSNLTSGVYSASLVVSNNDPTNSLMIIKVTLEVEDRESSISVFHIPDQVLFLTDTMKINISDYNFNISETNLIMNILNSDNAVANVELVNNQLVIYPLSIGKSVLTLYITEGSTLTSDTFNIEILKSETVQIKNNQPDHNLHKLDLYPNPVNEKLFFNLDIEEDGLTDLSIYTLTGEVVLNDTFEQASEMDHAVLNVNNLYPGIYILEVVCNNKRYTSKFIKE
jgi:Zn-dependent metalloprotease